MLFNLQKQTPPIRYCFITICYERLVDHYSLQDDLGSLPRYCIFNVYLIRVRSRSLSKQLEALAETLSKLPTQLHSKQPSPSSVLQVAGCVICGGAHDSGCYISTEDTTHEVNCMGNQPRPNFNAGGYFGFQHGQQYNQQ